MTDIENIEIFMDCFSILLQIILASPPMQPKNGYLIGNQLISVIFY